MRNIIILTTALAAIVSFSIFAESSIGGEIKEQKKEAVHTQKALPWNNMKTVKPEKPDIPDEYKDLEKAFSLYWDTYMKKDYKKLYSMESSTFRKANPYNEEKYRKLTAINMKLTAVTALKIEKLNNKEVLVKGNYYYNLRGIKSLNRFKDSWVKEDEGWTHIPTEGPLMKMQTKNKTDKDPVNKQQKNEVKITDKKNIEQTKGGVH